MSIKEGKDYLYLIWKSEKNRKQYIIGQLFKNTNYEFRYYDEVNEAKEQGFIPLVAFPQLDVVYNSDVLFPVFESRLPDKKRKDIESILQKYGLQEYEPYQLLKRSGARLPIDSMYFVEPISDLNKPLKRNFHLAGPRHYIGCNGTECNKSLDVVVGEKVILELDPENQADKNAIKVFNEKKQMLGFIPRYYSRSLSEIIQAGRTVTCHVTNVDKNKNCDECIGLELEVE